MFISRKILLMILMSVYPLGVFAGSISSCEVAPDEMHSAATTTAGLHAQHGSSHDESGKEMTDDAELSPAADCDCCDGCASICPASGSGPVTASGATVEPPELASRTVRARLASLHIDPTFHPLLRPPISLR